MKVKTYEYIWNQIQRTINEIQNRYQKDNLNKIFHFHLLYGDQTKNIIQNRYIAIRDELKNMCYAKNDVENALLDQHKLAACFCKAIIDKKVFSFIINNETPDDMIRSNYELAYISGLKIIQIYLLDRYKKKYGEESEQVNEIKKGLFGPITTHDPYHLGRIKTLALNDFYGINFDILTYSDMMFWIEFYNRQKIENVIDPQN